MRLTIATLLAVLCLSAYTAGQSGWSSSCADGSCQQPRDQASVEPIKAVVRVLNWVTQNQADAGSGVLVLATDDSGYVLTAGHIFRDKVGDKIQVEFPDGRRFSARLVKVSNDPDLALLCIRRPPINPLRLVRNAIAKGISGLLACGYGSDGRYRARSSRSLGYRGRHFLVTGVAHGGDSGGPIIDSNGCLVGIIWGSEGGNTYAVNADDIAKFLDAIDHLKPKPPTIDTPDPGHVEQLEPTPSLDALLDEISALRRRVALLESRPIDTTSLIGPAGPQGSVGPRGPPGRDGVSADLQSFADNNPIQVELYGPDGSLIDQTTVSLGGVLRLQLFERGN